MFSQITADMVVLFHLAFIVFVTAGGVLLFRWPGLVWLHGPCVVWAVTVQLTGWICPLTPLETALRRAAGGGGYDGGFVDHYVIPLIYPPGLTRDTQYLLGAIVVSVNLAIYAALFIIKRRRRS